MRFEIQDARSADSHLVLSPFGSLQNLELMMGLEPMTSPLPRECSTTELHQPSCCLRSPALRSSIRARIFAITTRKANRLRNRIGSHRTSTSRSAMPTYLEEYPCMWITAAGSMVNQDSKPKTTKTPRAMNIRPRSAAGLSDRSLSLTPVPRFPQKMVHRGGFEPP